MPLTLRHLNADSTWLVTLASPSGSHTPFQILLDPWLDFPSPVYHPKFSLQEHSIPCAVSSLAQLPRVPDIVVISQDKADHCHEETCRQLPKKGVKIYAVPGADKTVRSWKWFDGEEVVGLKTWKKSRRRVEKVYIYNKHGKESQQQQKDSGKKDGDGSSDGSECRRDERSGARRKDVAAVVEIAYLPALRPWEMPALHAAVGITYTPVEGVQTSTQLPLSPPPTPPPSNETTVDSAAPTASMNKTRASSFFSTFSSSSTSKGASSLSSDSQYSPDTVSIVYSPHGVNASAIADYLTTIPRPLTLLLHCFDHIQNPWWLGGNISTGAGTMLKLLRNLQEEKEEAEKWKLGVKYWVSTHDEEKILGGFTAGYVRKKRWPNEKVVKEIRKVTGNVAVSVLGENATTEVADGDADDIKELQVLQMAVDETVNLE